jgi:hypothetical protein
MRILGKDDWLESSLENQTGHDELHNQSKRLEDRSSPGYIPKPENIRTI